MSYGKIERQVEAYGEWLRIWRHRESQEERDAWTAHAVHARAGDKYREACSKARGSPDSGRCTCPSMPGFQDWATEEKRLGGLAHSLTYPRLEAIRRDMDVFRADLKRRSEAINRLKLSRARHEHLGVKACIGT